MMWFDNKMSNPLTSCCAWQNICKWGYFSEWCPLAPTNCWWRAKKYIRVVSKFKLCNVAYILLEVGRHDETPLKIMQECWHAIQRKRCNEFMFGKCAILLHAVGHRKSDKVNAGWQDSLEDAHLLLLHYETAFLEEGHCHSQTVGCRRWWNSVPQKCKCRITDKLVAGKYVAKLHPRNMFWTYKL